MKTKLVTSFLICFLSFCLPISVTACPPPSCPDCYTGSACDVYICGCWPSPIGFSVWPSKNNRYVCIDDTVTFSAWPYTWDGDGCPLIYSWDFGRDAYDPCTGAGNWVSCRYSSPGDRTVTLTVTRVTIPNSCCSTSRTDSFSRTVTVVELASVTSDKDSPATCENVTFTVTTNPPGHEDLDIVQWSGGGCPESQDGGTTFTTRWPCVGDKIVTASYCNSSKSKGVTVTLPAGCSNAGAHDSSVHWDDTTNYFDTPPENKWGYFDCCEVTCATCDVDFRYNNCTWVCKISNVVALTDVEVWPPNRPGYVSITKASDVPCGPNNSEALLAKSDLNDPDLTDDVGADLKKYWIHLAICAHEEKHRADWKAYYGLTLATAILIAETITQNISCDAPYTCTCQGAESYWMDQIVWLFENAWNEANRMFDNPATTDLNESEVRAYLVENSIEQPVSDALPGGCTP